MMSGAIKYVIGLLFYFVIADLAAQEEMTNTIGMRFVKVAAGEFTVGKFEPPYPTPDDTLKFASHPYTMWMGDGRGYSTEEFRLAKEMALRDATTGFKVIISKAFYIGKFEVTQAQWKKVMGSNPSAFQGEGYAPADSLPVENVTWEMACEFIARLNKMEKTKRYRLPTEFEWEYAARAGMMDDISWKDIRESAQLGKRTTMPIGRMKPNALGIYDMLGNVCEWVEDYYNEKIFADPVPPRKGDQHVLKGASFAGDVKNATFMTHAGGPGNGWDVGFRIVMEEEKRKSR
jgi:sulfatase modifying factor 1